MRQTRLNMQEGRKKKEFRFGEEAKDLELKARTINGQKLIRSQDVSKEEIQDREKKMEVVGADVESLYPSLNDEVVANLVYEAILETDMKFLNINYKEGVRYLALNWSEKECRTSNLRRVQPWRANNRGVRPGITGEGPLGPGEGPLGPGEGKVEQWIFPRVVLTELEKKKIVARFLQIVQNSHLQI